MTKIIHHIIYIYTLARARVSLLYFLMFYYNLSLGGKRKVWKPIPLVTAVAITASLIVVGIALGLGLGIGLQNDSQDLIFVTTTTTKRTIMTIGRKNKCESI